MKQFNLKVHLALILAAVLLTVPVAHFSDDSILRFITVSRINMHNILDPSKPMGEGIILDEAGVPLYDYGYKDGYYIGVQRNPTIISQQAFY